MSLEEKKRKFALARGSSQAKKVAVLQKECIDKVNDAKALALVGKEAKKKKKKVKQV